MKFIILTRVTAIGREVSMHVNIETIGNFEATGESGSLVTLMTLWGDDGAGVSEVVIVIESPDTIADRITRATAVEVPRSRRITQVSSVLWPGVEDRWPMCIVLTALSNDGMTWQKWGDDPWAPIAMLPQGSLADAALAVQP